MAGERIIVRGAQTTLEASGASVANNAVVAATTSYNSGTTGGGYPDAEFVLTAIFSTAPTESTVVSLLARPLDLDGTSDAQVPEAARPTRVIGSFVVDNVTTAQTMVLLARELPEIAEYYLYNNGTGQTIAAGWSLKVKPRSEKAAA